MADKILIVDDDIPNLHTLGDLVKDLNYESDFAIDGGQAVEKAMKGEYALMLLDINMPVKDGFQVIKELREAGNKTPVIVLSGRDSLADTAKGLDIGADDYIAKPSDPIVISSKIRAMLRRTQANGDNGDKIVSGPFELDNAKMRFSKNGNEILLTGKELSIMRLFMLNPGKTFPKSLIYDQVWSNAVTDENAIMVYINRIRQKIEDDASNPKYIVNVRGIGYKYIEG